MDNRLVVIPNGYDEADFSAVPFVPGRRAAPFVLVHSGLLYPDGRDPSVFFAVLGKLKRLGKAGTGMFREVLRASGSEARYQQQIDRYDIADIVTLAPPVGSREALLEQAAADGLLLFQGSLFDRQIPAWCRSTMNRELSRACCGFWISLPKGLICKRIDLASKNGHVVTARFNLRACLMRWQFDETQVVARRHAVR
jgi:hypothetical protein